MTIPLPLEIKESELFFEGKQYINYMKIQIHFDLVDEDEEYFTAELQPEFFDANPFAICMATITIRDTVAALCTFNRSEYSVLWVIYTQKYLAF